MNFKKLISAALCVVMMFTAIVAAMPITASAAYSSSSSASNAIVPGGSTEANLTMEQLLDYLGASDKTAKDPNSYINYNFENVSDMLAYELSKGLLYSVDSTGSYYSLYVNKYTGFVYYVNNITGQILTSNPINPGYVTDTGSITVQSEMRSTLMSQITVEFFETSSPTNSYTYDSYAEAAVRGQISVSPISGGYRVSYVLGDTTARYLLPGMVMADKFEENIFVPMIKYYESLILEYCSVEGSSNDNLKFFDSQSYEAYDQYGYINQRDRVDETGKKLYGLSRYLRDTENVYTDMYRYGSPEYKRIDKAYGDLMTFVSAYTLYNPQDYKDNNREYALEGLYSLYPVLKNGKAIYVYSASQLDAVKEGYANIIKTYCPEYTFSMMYEDEKECGYEDKSPQKPVFRCALEYSFNSDGTLSVSLPASSITFDETVYTLSAVTPLKFFGCGDMEEFGYIFYPDGSGTVVDFSDFYNEEIGLKTSINLSSTVYGADFGYSNITGAHRQQITMPVYGVVNEVNASAITQLVTGKSTVVNGYFAVLEEGSALANLGFTSGGSAHKFATAFASYNPYPSDVYDLSETISVGSIGTYTIVSDSKYTGAYTTRYTMLTDKSMGNSSDCPITLYESSYNGMAACYRDYLIETGVLEALEAVSTDLPLYIEVLGSMKITKKILTFPVSVSIPLTTFKDVKTMYNQLHESSKYVDEQVAYYTELIANETDEAKINNYRIKLDSFTALKGNIEETIDNINFKLTGFANGGMYYTYPVKVKWDKAVGGKSGFKSLIKTAKAATDGDVNFGIYPDFDFMYINNTAMFDGIRIKGTVSRMVDNRYASKQLYNEVLMMFESCLSLVVSPDALNGLYSKFVKKYSKFDIDTMSVSTLGSALNSNFDEENPINREEAKDYVTALLDKMANKNEYELMIDTGNIYAVEYATHILNVATDSSHFRYSSYTVPFIGLVLHGYVNYAGTPINYSGLIEYEILRSIENGAAVYFLVCYQNTGYMKEDSLLSKYYGVDYANWYEQILTIYAELNAAIGELQEFNIVEHSVLIAERVIDEDEYEDMINVLSAELIEMLDKQIAAAIDVAFDSLREEEAYDTTLKFVLTDADRAAIIAIACESLNVDVATLEEVGFIANFDKLVAAYEAEYSAEGKENVKEISFSSFKYETKYSYVTDSYATDSKDNYVYTDFTCDNNNVVLVTYKKGDEAYRFILNYNNYSVTVRLEGEEITLGAYSYDKSFVGVVEEEVQ